MPEGLSVKELLPSIILVAGILAAMWVALWLASRAIRRWADQIEEKDKERVEEVERWAKQLTQFVRRSIEVVAGVAALFIILRGLGVRGFPQLTWEQVGGWLAGPGLRILLVLGGAYVLSRVAGLLIGRLPMLIVPRGGLPSEVAEEEKRATTITRLLSMLATTVITVGALLIVLRELGVNITPILTGAGIVGLAVGFGAQNLVRDLITGFFLILENQVRVGDVAIINGKGGLVEEIRLRTVVLRGLDGTVHVIPNGTINEISNMTKDFSFALLDIGVAYKEDTDHVVDVLREVAAELRRDPNYAGKILDNLEILGVDAFADSAVMIKIRIKTVPIQQWSVAREMRRRIKKVFDHKGIEIPFPHMSVYFGEASKPFAVQAAEELAGRPSQPTVPGRGSS
jgi:small conductance mechanosensitive channel